MKKIRKTESDACGRLPTMDKIRGFHQVPSGWILGGFLLIFWSTSALFAQYGSIGATVQRSPAVLEIPTNTAYLAPGTTQTTATAPTQLDFTPQVTPYLAQSTTSATSYGSTPAAGSTTTSGTLPGFTTSTHQPANLAVTGSAAPVATTIDPYAVPEKRGLFETISSEYHTYVPQTYQSMKRFCEVAAVQYHLMAGGGNHGLQINDISGRLQFAIPCSWLPSSTSRTAETTALYLSPGVQFSWWEGGSYAMPPLYSASTFAAYLDIGMRPQLTETFSLDAWLRVGIYSDYEKVTNKSWRVQGRAMGLFKIADRWEGTAGLIYLDRNHIKVLPSGGVIWKPHEDLVVRLVFPDPNVSLRLRTSGSVEWWTYLQADYGGGTWTIYDPYDGAVRTDYNDIRLALGLKFDNPACLGGFVEIGGAFAREVVRPNWGTWKPDSAFYFRVGLTY